MCVHLRERTVKRNMTTNSTTSQKVSSPSFVTPAGAALLENYTRLPKTVQGALSPSGNGLSPTRTDTATSDVATFRALIPHLKGGYRTIDVSNFTLLSVDGTLGNAGKPVKGPKPLSGVFVPVKDSVPPRLVGTAISSQVVEGHPAGTPMLVSFLASDDHSTASIPFGSQTPLMPLAPVSSYLQWIMGGLLKRALIACPNGAFLLEHRPPRRSETELQRNREILDNVVRRMSIVVDARRHHASAEGGTGLLCRGASTVLVVLDGVMDLPSLNAFCRNLGTGPYGKHGEVATLETGGTFAVSSGILDVDSSPGPTVAKVRKAASSAFTDHQVTVEVQPLSEWKSSPLTIVAKIKVLPSSSTTMNSAITPLEAHMSLHAGRLDLKVTGGISLDGIRLPKPGETPRAVEKQVERIIESETKKVISGGPSDGWNNQHELDAISSKLADAIRGQVAAAEVYTSEPKVVMELRQERTPAGRETRMPSGTPAIIPAYAVSAMAPRLAVVLGVLPSLGSTVRFFSWQTAEHNGIPLQ